MVASIDATYYVLSGYDWDDLNEWVAGGEAPRDATANRPDPLMDFSPYGLKFEDQKTCKPGDYVLIEAKLPGERVGWRMAARVVRIEGVPPRHRMTSTGLDPTHRIAVEFLTVEPGGTAALASLTERMQDFEMRHRAEA
jgi:hypothetical protein